MTMQNAVAQPCSTCGELVSLGDHFCGSCGAEVGTTSGRPPAQFDHRGGRHTGRRVVAVIAAFFVVAAVSGLVVAFLDARKDLESERERTAAAQAQVVDLDAQLQATADPDDTLQQQLADAELDVTDLMAQLQQAQTDLTTERDGRAADVAAATADKTETVAAIQTELDAAQVRLTALQAAFPLSEAAFRSAAPSGEYAVTIQPIECTIVDCFDLRSLALSFPDPTKVSGNRANGIIAFADGSYSVSGPLADEQSPFCNAETTDATFSLQFHASRVTFEAGVLAATEMIGTYRETIDSGDCAGQFRSYSLTLTKS